MRSKAITNPDKVHTVTIDPPATPFSAKARCAVAMLALGIDNCGIDGKYRVMSPYKKFTDRQVAIESVNLLSHIFLALSDSLPLKWKLQHSSHSEHFKKLMEKGEPKMIEMKEVSMSVRVLNALHVAMQGAASIGQERKVSLMAPLTEFTDEEVEMEAANLLADVMHAFVDKLDPIRAKFIEDTHVKRLAFILGEEIAEQYRGPFTPRHPDDALARDFSTSEKDCGESFTPIKPMEAPSKEKVIKINVEMKPVSLEQKILSATYISAHGVNHCGIKTKAELMWPHKEFTDSQVAREASSLLGRVHAAQLGELPRPQHEQILADQAERLSLAL